MSDTLSPVQFGNPWASAGAADFSASLTTALPPGDAWTGPIMAELMAGCGQAFATLHARAYQLSEIETVPSLTTELIGFWETDYGLPDCCTPLGSTLQQRRNTLLAKIAQIGGQSPAYYIAVAAALGFTVTITEGPVGSFEWTVNVPEAITPQFFRAGSQAGTRLEYWSGNDELECVLRQIMPAHTVLNFAYGS